jgi:CheY-like chemotaxis protein
MRRQPRSRGLHVTVYGRSDGREGFRKAVDLRLDLVITDLAMPIMDGWETIRRRPRKHERTPCS